MFGGQNRRYAPRPQWVNELQKRQSVFVHFALALTAFIYMVLGALLFMWLEATPDPVDGQLALDMDDSDGGADEGYKQGIEGVSLSQKSCLMNVLERTENGSYTALRALSRLSSCLTEPGAKTWRFPTALLFTFTVITTIGYGNIAPVTILGRLFCIIYGLIGIPLTMMAIANVGKFLTDMGRKCSDRVVLLFKPCTRRYKRWRRRRKHKQSVALKNRIITNNNNPDVESGDANLEREFSANITEEELNELNQPQSSVGQAAQREQSLSAEQLCPMSPKTGNNRHTDLKDNDDEPGIKVIQLDNESNFDSCEESEDDSGEEYSSGFQTLMVMIAFFIYVCIGGFVLPLYEDDMNFFTALYFNFVTLTTVGLGDMVPTSEKFLLFTMFYITIGLALTTIAIEVASDYLQKLHHFGRKVENTGNTTIWFGGKKITMKKLMKNVGEKYGIKELEHPEMMPNLLDTIVGAAIEKDENKNFELPKMRVPDPPEEPPEEVPVLQAAPKTPTPEPEPELDQGDPVTDDMVKLLLQLSLCSSEQYDKYNEALPTPLIMTPTGYLAQQTCEMVPLLAVDQSVLDMFDPYVPECASEQLTQDTLLEARLVSSDAFPPLILLLGAVLHDKTPQTQELPPATPTPPPSPPKPKKKVKTGKVDLSKVNDPKLRYELYQKEWAKYNTHLLETKEAKAAAAKEKEKTKSKYKAVASSSALGAVNVKTSAAKPSRSPRTSVSSTTGLVPSAAGAQSKQVLSPTMSSASSKASSSSPRTSLKTGKLPSARPKSPQPPRKKDPPSKR